MSTAANSTPASSSTAEPDSTSWFGRIIELTARAGTSWFGLVAGYFAALGGALLAYQKLEEPLKGQPSWVRPLVAVAPLVFVVIFHTLPALIDQRRRKRLKEISGEELKPGYFRLTPRDDEKDFTRADKKHEEVLRWIKERRAPVLYLTGQSGSGKSSVLAGCVIPRLSKDAPGVKLIQLRGYQDPTSILLAKLRQAGTIWKTAPDVSDTRELLERACRHIRPQKLLLVFDQFEEFVILHDAAYCQLFADLLTSLLKEPIDGLTVLLVLRSDYLGILEHLGLPKLIQDTNWKEVPPFTEKAASSFLKGSNLQISEDVLRDVLREAAEIEQTKGLIRPVTLNLCGLVLGRFATGLPRGFRPGGMIRGFIRESVELPAIREVTPRVIPALITHYTTKRPRTVAELAEETGLESGTIRGCLHVLGQPERGVVRPLDDNQERWEISHDFLVPLLDAIFARWSVSLWRRTRPFLPWVAAASMALIAVAISLRAKDPILELAQLGWEVHPGKSGFTFKFDGKPRWPESVPAFRRVRGTFHLDVSQVGVSSTPDSLTGIEALRDVKNLLSLDLSGTRVGDLSLLGELKSLSSVKLSSTSVADLSPLRELKNLKLLDLSNTYVTDLSPLGELKNLRSLDLSKTSLITFHPSDRLSSTSVTDLSPLRELKSLSSLNLNGTKVTDIRPLRELKSLSSLDLRNTSVTDLSPLRELKSLSWLDLSGTKVTDIRPLGELKSLSLLNLNGTKVADIRPLRELESLTWLDLNGTKVTDFRPLGELKNLKSLGGVPRSGFPRW